ncbi:MAG: glycosyltransferase family 4 protein [Fibromonadaceae bacterium]|jgi:glycosyltransferase involved in cell wall biosynthesis|nr:glycosyltransferase family 4 protein [Fibromonadaceae bacterium]
MSHKVDGNKLVVCQFIQYATPYCGNFMYSLFDLEKKIKERNDGSEIIYVFYKNTINCQWAKEMLQTNKKIFFLTNKTIKGFLELRKILKDNKVNILHFHMTFPFLILFLSKLFYLHIKMISHFHTELYGNSASSPIVRRIKKIIKVFLCKYIFDMACGVSEAIFIDLINSGVRREKCCYIDNGIDFSRLDIDCENGREMYKIHDKKILTIFGSSVLAFYNKGVDIAINAIKDIAEQYGIALVIVCDNRDYVLQEIQKIFKFVPKWIIIAPSQENVVFYFKMSDIHLSPSRMEGFSYANLEAIYCGTPVIRSDRPEMDRNIPDDIIFPLNDISALQKSIISVLNQAPDAKKAALKKQREYIVSRWNIGIWSNKMLNMYLQLSPVSSPSGNLLY